MLLKSSYYERLFSPFENKAVGFVPLSGNVGDLMNHAATEQLFRCFGIDFRVLSSRDVEAGRLCDKVDEIVVSGGGNMGGPFYRGPYTTRQSLLCTGLPVTVFPQSFIQNSEDIGPYKKVYARDKVSLTLDRRLELAPDPVLAFEGPLNDAGKEVEVGVFMRTGRESGLDRSPLSLGDPARICVYINEYLELASKFSHVVTDRLHFGVAALLLGRRVTLLPNSYFKNRAFFETWLRHRCEWRDDLNGIRYDKLEVERALFDRLTSPPSRFTPWDHMPEKNEEFDLAKLSRQPVFYVDGTRFKCSTDMVLRVWRRCNGTRTLAEIVDFVFETSSAARIEAARDVQNSVQILAAAGAIAQN